MCNWCLFDLPEISSMYVFDMNSLFCWNEREGVVGMFILETMQASLYIVFIFIYIEKNINRMCIIRIYGYSDVIIFLNISLRCKCVPIMHTHVSNGLNSMPETKYTKLVVDETKYSIKTFHSICVIYSVLYPNIQPSYWNCLLQNGRIIVNKRVNKYLERSH
jgi:hypothetical protein